MGWTISRFDHLVNFFGASHSGRLREENEDAWRADPVTGLFALADGMGGHAAGEVAAWLATQTVATELARTETARVLDAYLAEASLGARRAVFERLVLAVREAHAHVLAEAKRDGRRRGMGCTLDVVVLVGDDAFIAHVGDGRVYVTREATTIQLTQDHTLGRALLERGLGSISDPPPANNALTNAIGRDGDLAVDEVFVSLGRGDRLLLCSDGIFAELGDEQTLDRLSRLPTPQDAVLGLINAALEAGGRDNATALLVEVLERRTQRRVVDGGLAHRDDVTARNCPLLTDLNDADVSRALSASVEIEVPAGATIPRMVADDRVAYIVLEGEAAAPSGWVLGPSSLIYPESLAAGGRNDRLCKVRLPMRALRIRAGDFAEVCASDLGLAATLYRRLARTLARML